MFRAVPSFRRNDRAMRHCHSCAWSFSLVGTSRSPLVFAVLEDVGLVWDVLAGEVIAIEAEPFDVSFAAWHNCGCGV